MNSPHITNFKVGNLVSVVREIVVITLVGLFSTSFTRRRTS